MAGVGANAADGKDASRSALDRTMFATNPRPRRRLKLGVGSFCAGGRRNAGEGLVLTGTTCGVCGDGFGDGCMGRASEGVVAGEGLTEGDETGVVVGFAVGVTGR
jgi:hypothetical protein